MLTHDEILQVAEWKDRVGERRPGFLHDHAKNLHGPVSACQPLPAQNGSGAASGEEVLEFNMVFESDPTTGEKRLVRK